MNDRIKFERLNMYIENLKKENDRLREALEFYSDRKNYEMNVSLSIEIYCAVLKDQGETATKVLK